MAARASFSNDSRIVKMPLPESVLLKDYLLDDLSSCSSNGFRSYPRRQCCTKIRYLIEIDLNKHIKLPPTHKQFLKIKSIPKSKSKLKLKSPPVLHRASTAVVNVFKSFRLSGAGSGSANPRKPNFLPKNLYGFWKRTTGQKKTEFKRLDSFDERIKQTDNNILPPASTVSAAVTTTATAEMNTSTNNSNNSSNSSATSDSYFTGNEKKGLQGKEKDQFSPISVIDFPGDNDIDDDEDEVTSPFQHSPLCAKGYKRKLMSKVQKTKSLTQLKPVRLEDRITLSESRGLILESSLQIQHKFAAEKKAIALLQLLKASMSSHDLSESTMTGSMLLGFFTERFIEGNVSNYIILQEAKDWVNGQTKEMFESQGDKLTYIKEMEKEVKWLKYREEETKEVVSEVEYEVFTSLVEETLLIFYL